MSYVSKWSSLVYHGDEDSELARGFHTFVETFSVGENVVELSIKLFENGLITQGGPSQDMYSTG